MLGFKHPRKVLCKKHLHDDSILHQMVKKDVNFSNKDCIDEILFLRLNDEIKKYLQEKTRLFCKNEEDKNYAQNLYLLFIIYIAFIYNFRGETM